MNRYTIIRRGQNPELRLALIDYDAQHRLTPAVRKEIARGKMEPAAVFSALWELRKQAENN